MKNFLFTLALLVSFTSLAGPFDVNVSTDNEDMLPVIIVVDQLDLQAVDVFTLDIKQLKTSISVAGMQDLITPVEDYNHSQLAEQRLEPDLINSRTYSKYNQPIVDKLSKANAFRSWCIS